MGTWSMDVDGSDAAADWFASALTEDIDDALQEALSSDDSYDEQRAAVYLLTVLGHSSYVWPGDLDRLDGHVTAAIERMEAMLEQGSDAHEELSDLWEEDAPILFAKIQAELVALQAARER